jgi:hypothetical protein
MKHKIIQTENYLLVVDDLDIKEGDWLYSMSNQLVVQSNKGSADIINSKVTVDVLYLKIIAHLPLNNSPILDGIDLLPPLEDEDDVEKLADKIYPETYYSGIYVDRWLKAGFIQGYNKAKERYKWTDEDVIRIVEKSRETGLTAEYLMLSLQQPKIPVGFDCEIEKKEGRLMVIPPCKHCIKPKTITNSQGINQWVGKYIFD